MVRQRDLTTIQETTSMPNFEFNALLNALGV